MNGLATQSQGERGIIWDFLNNDEKKRF